MYVKAVLVPSSIYNQNIYFITYLTPRQDSATTRQKRSVHRYRSPARRNIGRDVEGSRSKDVGISLYQVGDPWPPCLVY